MARRDLDPDQRDKAPLVFSQLVDCDGCGETQEVDFVAPPGVYDAEDLVGQMETLVVCSCGAQWKQPYEGWSIHDES